MILFNQDDLDIIITAFKRAINTWSPAPKKLVTLIEELEDVRLRL